MNPVRAIKVKRDPSIPREWLPERMSAGASGFDLRSSEYVTIDPGEWTSVSTGLYLEIPEGYEGQIRPRSGMAWNCAVTVLNAPGTIDSDYRGEVMVMLINHGQEKYTLTPGARIAQIVFAPVPPVLICDVEELSQTERSKNGFGSTGNS